MSSKEDPGKEASETLGSFLSQFGEPTLESRVALGVLFEVLCDRKQNWKSVLIPGKKGQSGNQNPGNPPGQR